MGSLTYPMYRRRCFNLEDVVAVSGHKGKPRAFPAKKQIVGSLGSRPAPASHRMASALPSPDNAVMGIDDGPLALEPVPPQNAARCIVLGQRVGIDDGDQVIVEGVLRQRIGRFGGIAPAPELRVHSVGDLDNA